MKKRKMEEMGDAQTSTQEQLRTLLDPLAKPQLVDLLSRLYVILSSIFLRLKVSF